MDLPEMMHQISLPSLNLRAAEMLIMSLFLLMGQSLRLPLPADKRKSRIRQLFLPPQSGDAVPGRWPRWVQLARGQARVWRLAM